MLDNLEKLQTLLEWVEISQDIIPIITPKPLQVMPPRSVTVVNTVQEKPIKYEKAILEKLERIEHDLAVTKDKMTQYDRTLELLTTNISEPVPARNKGFSCPNKTPE